MACDLFCNSVLVTETNECIFKASVLDTCTETASEKSDDLQKRELVLFWCFFWPCIIVYKLISFTNFNAQFLYSITICVLHYNPQHVSSINMPIFRRTNCIITASGIVTLCNQLYSTPDDSRPVSLLSSGILYSRLQRVTILDAVIIQFVLLKMRMLMLETCRGL